MCHLLYVSQGIFVCFHVANVADALFCAVTHTVTSSHVSAWLQLHVTVQENSSVALRCQDLLQLLHVKCKCSNS